MQICSELDGACAVERPDHSQTAVRQKPGCQLGNCLSQSQWLGTPVSSQTHLCWVGCSLEANQKQMERLLNSDLSVSSTLNHRCSPERQPKTCQTQCRLPLKLFELRGSCQHLLSKAALQHCKELDTPLLF